MSSSGPHATARRAFALDGARLTYDASVLVLGAPPGAIEIPAPSFLIEHERGLVLFDTGIAPDAAEDPSGVFGDLLPVSGLTSFSDAQRVDRQIEAAGFSVTDVTHVVISHAHFDHAGGLHLFPTAKLFAGAGELPNAFWPHSPLYCGHFRLADLEPTRGFDWNSLPGDHDVFGDGSIQILATPGHTPGHLSLLVRLPDGSLILTGDATHLRFGWINGVHMGFDFSGEQAIRSLQRLRRIADAEAAAVWINHDPDDWARFGGPGRIDPTR
ncbi:MAG: beta-lactamase domain protein [Pseudonocardiales bacterium]|nr:beta-lactamase domain protein [Pseudonocardiales bacterium]